MPVNTKHPDYIRMEPIMSQMRDTVAGEPAVKDRKTTYLPKPNPTDNSDQNNKRYEQYLFRANYVNVTGRTKNGLVGAIFRLDPTFEIPPAIEFMKEDADGSGKSLSQIAKHVAGEIIEQGRVGVLVDHPPVEGSTTLAEIRAKNIRAKMSIYNTEDILNWKYGSVNGRIGLVLVVLREWVPKTDDKFSHDKIERYRVLEMIDGVYTVTLFDKELNQISEAITPRKGGTKETWDFIPMIIPGAEENGQKYDEPPLLALSCINLAHYRNSADYEEGLFIHGQGTMFIDPGEVGFEAWNKKYPNGIMMGSRAGYVLGKGGEPHMIQMDANTASQEAMVEKERQMVSIGAKLISFKGSNETAEKARIDASSDSSVLSTVTGNASEAIEQALEYVAIFHGADPEPIEFTLNKEFWDEIIDPQTRMARIAELDRGLIAKSDYRGWLRKNGDLDVSREDEDIDEEVGNSGAGLGDV